MKRIFFAGMFGLAALAALGASGAEPELDRFRQMPIQNNGRIKPFDSFARETLWQITGGPQVGGQDPVGTILDIMAQPDLWQERPLLQVPFVPLREALGMSPKTTRISYSDLLSTRKLMRMLPAIVGKQKRSEKLTMLESETMDLFNRFVVFSDLIGQKLPLSPPASPQEREWLQPADAPRGLPSVAAPGASAHWLLIRQSPGSASWDALLEAWRNRDAPAFSQKAQELSRALRQANPAPDAAPWRMEMEVAYNRVAPFRVAQGLYLLAVVLLAVALAESWRWAGSAGFGTMVAGFLVHAAGISLRVILGGRPPVSNFYETMLWIPFVAVAIGLIFEKIHRGHYLALSAGILAVIMLSLAEWVPLDSGLVPVVAVLRSNWWLTIHVLTVVASYGALGLAGVLAHLYGWRYLAVAHRDALLEDLEQFLYHVIQVGVVLLAAGIMLGGVWANASWGRYWGWDPKETWALITLLWFLAALHGRFAGWLHGVGLALVTLGGLFLLLMTYYGVSFYLVGLHSYAGGHAKPLPPMLIAYVVVELIFMGWIGWQSWHRKRAGL